jgi:LytTr DNA-binding domain
MIHEFRLARWWLPAGMLLALLFALLDPQPSRGLALPWAWLYWSAHIVLALGLAIAATRWLGSRLPAAVRGTLPRLLLGGLLGSLLFAPVALGLEWVLPQPPAAFDDQDALDLLEARGGAWPVLVQWLHALPPFVVSWLLLNALPLTATTQLTPAAPVTGATDQTSEPAAPTVDAASANALLNRLPPAIGTDVIYIRSDLHYLDVRTSRGKATLLGNIADAASELGGQGLSVHRSWWVAVRHVKRVKRSSKGWSCEMSDGTRVPISRRRVAEVRARLGTDFVQEVD